MPMMNWMMTYLILTVVMVREHQHTKATFVCHALLKRQYTSSITERFLADEQSRRELHEMFVPTALKQRWTELDNPVMLSSYYFKFSPNPVDRDYRKFGLFVKEPLPKEAEKMRLDLLLDHGRSVLTELIPYGVSYFKKEEVKLSFLFFHGLGVH